MPTNFVIGQALILVARKQVASERGRVLTVPLKWLLAYSAFVFVPVTGWYFYNHPAWSTVYLRAEETIAWWWGPIIVGQYFIGMMFGGLLAQTLIQLGHKKMVYLTLSLGLFWLAGIWGFTLDQYLHIGSYTQYQLGAATEVFADFAFQKELNVMGAILFIPVILLAAHFIRSSKKL